MGRKPGSRVEGLLEELCVGHGYCLPPDDRARLVARPPADPQSFVDAVLRAEGLDPELCDDSQRRRLTDVVERWLSDPEIDLPE